MHRTPVLLRSAALALAFAGYTAPLLAQEIRYDVSFPDAVHHEARVLLTLRGVPADRPVEIVMPRSSPGRYALHEFAKNVYEVSATDGAGRALHAEAVTPYEWRVAGHDGIIAFTYTVFGDRVDGTYLGIDSSHAHINMPAALAFARGFDDRPVTIAFRPVNGWRIATQLAPTADPNVFTAPHLQYLMDSPTELSAFRLREWKAGPEGRYTIRIALHEPGSEAQADSFAAGARRIVAEEAAVFGGLPAYDFGTYTFIADYLPWGNGDGMEHRNSTVITSARTFAKGMKGHLNTLAHEFFHSWNMERIRDRDLEPFDFERANQSENLWFGEGFTSYYDALVTTRAGTSTFEDFVANAGGVIDAVVNAPGRELRSAVNMSEHAPFSDAAVSIDPTNQRNTFLSYYTYGEAIALGLDLTLRQRFDRTLDDYMRLMWEKFGRLQEGRAPRRPYTRADLQSTLAELTRDSAFAADFFRRYIEGREVQDYATLLAPAGMLLRPANPGKPTLGNAIITFEDGRAVVRTPPARGTPLYRAGIDSGDVLVSLDGRPVGSAEALAAVLELHHPGDVIAAVIEQLGVTKSRTIRLSEDPALEVVTFEAAGRSVGAQVRRFRQSWLSSRAADRTAEH